MLEMKENSKFVFTCLVSGFFVCLFCLLISAFKERITEQLSCGEIKVIYLSLDDDRLIDPGF
jgi:hypothetical protein